MDTSPTDAPLDTAAVFPERRDVLGTTALVAAAVSFAGFLVLIIGHLVDPSGFNNGKHPDAANNLAFFAYVLGLLIALILGAAVWFHGRRSGRTGPRSPAALATYYGLAFLVVTVVAAMLGG
ncbi:hypothetical protein [Allobranchiibius sp. CTAmp26]|uniref:hypothetical protein n=1 Tax=Allobranchiibius sp. CTAmp26 TaxID=2815214 RepID=UPI001AA1B6CD|nr:hypothetical protein [Allobranchiibius sp. CTAmp26]MBO1754392.1 hypothetical protein [Allobranchiibius sp. CTAmp26]